ncbi:OsmC family protein [Rapidithrix thailandica]|uniref:OsmC family protein n=1 Tax=Rapidithrix thailandica TaxID=413964 RepID=A0AAW9SB52_9BACT
MTTFNSSYQGNLRTKVQHNPSKGELITDAPVDNHGKGESFSPTDLVAVALGSCMATIMGILAEREQIDLSGLRYTTEKVMQSSPRKISEVIIHFTLADSQLSDQDKKKLIKAALNCPVALSLHPDLKQTVSFDI